MTYINMQRRLAATILKCGRNKIWFDPNEATEISNTNSRHAMRKLIRNGLVIRRPNVIHSRARVRRRLAAKAKGRHTGMGKRHGTRETRMPSKVLWVRRIRVLRRLLKKQRDARKIDKHHYRELYQRAKGNQFKNKRVLLETIHEELAVKNLKLEVQKKKVVVAGAQKKKEEVAKVEVKPFAKVEVVVKAAPKVEAKSAPKVTLPKK